jgi:hypothetical protein
MEGTFHFPSSSIQRSSSSSFKGVRGRRLPSSDPSSGCYRNRRSGLWFGRFGYGRSGHFGLRWNGLRCGRLRGRRQGEESQMEGKERASFPPNSEIDIDREVMVRLRKKKKERKRKMREKEMKISERNGSLNGLING